MRTMKIAAAAAVLACVPALAAPLPPDTVLTKPGVGLPAPNYTAGLPSYFTSGNLVQTLAAPLTIDFTGTVTSQVYSNPLGGFTFAYTFENTSSSAGDIVRATFNPAGWAGVTISDAGSDGSGTSTPGSVAPVWSDGDPNLIGRADQPSGGYPYIQWRVANVGTVVAPGNTSAVIWLETNRNSIATSNVALLDGGLAGKANVLVPVIPAPAAVVLGLLGLGMVGWVRRHSR